MSANHLTPDVFFQALTGFSSKHRPAPIWLYTDDSSGVAPLFAVNETPANVFFLGTGQHFVDRASDVMHTVGSSLLVLSGMEGWDRSIEEMTNAFRQFYGGATGLPGVVWLHQVCWSDRGIAKAAHEANLKIQDIDHQAIHFDEPIRLSFDHLNRDSIGIDGGRLAWATPVDGPARTTGFVKITQSRYTRQNRLLKSASHRQQVGVAALSAEHEWFLNQGLHPSQMGRAYALFDNPKTKQVAVRPSGLSSPHKPLRPDTSCGRLVDSLGIYDVVLLKLVRLNKRAVVPGSPRIVSEQMSFALDRRTGHIVYICSSRERFAEMEDDHFDRTLLGQWLSKKI